MSSLKWFNRLPAIVLSCLCVLAWLALCPLTVRAGDHFNTYPQPPKTKPRDPLYICPGYELPPEHQRYTWKTTGKNPRGQVRYKDSVPVYYIDPYKRISIGEIPIGTEVKLDTVAHFRGVMHFRIPYQSAFLDKVLRVGWRGYAWISGEFIEATAFKPAG
jgi:hypothetical protein